jgi:hypothetical protein
MDLSGVPVIDNHCHTSTLKKTTLEPLSLAQEFYHGFGDSLDPTGRAAKGLVSGTRQEDIAQFGVVHTLVAQLAVLFECEATLEAVTAERNRRTEAGLSAYAQMLYQNAGIVGTVVDSDLPPGAPDFDLTPGRILRLFQMGPAIDRCLAKGGSYDALLEAYLAELEHAVRADRFIGVKSHLGEVVGFSAVLSAPGEGEGAWLAARTGDQAAYKRLYAALHRAYPHGHHRRPLGRPDQRGRALPAFGAAQPARVSHVQSRAPARGLPLGRTGLDDGARLPAGMAGHRLGHALDEPPGDRVHARVHGRCAPLAPDDRHRRAWHARGGLAGRQGGQDRALGRARPIGRERPDARGERHGCGEYDSVWERRQAVRNHRVRGEHPPIRPGSQ